MREEDEPAERVRTTSGRMCGWQGAAGGDLSVWRQVCRQTDTPKRAANTFEGLDDVRRPFGGRHFTPWRKLISATG